MTKKTGQKTDRAANRAAEAAIKRISSRGLRNGLFFVRNIPTPIHQETQ